MLDDTASQLATPAIGLLAIAIGSTQELRGRLAPFFMHVSTPVLCLCVHAAIYVDVCVSAM